MSLNFLDSETKEEGYEFSNKFSCKAVCLQSWAAQIRDCQNRPEGMNVDEWCRQNNITKANYYYRLKRVRQACLVQLLISQQEQNKALTKELRELNQKMQVLMEQMVLANKNRFGRSSEKMEIENQICFKEVDGNIVFFNEAEAVCNLEAEEPEDLEIKPARKPKTVGKKQTIWQDYR